MAAREKRIDAMRRNPRNVRFAELRAVLEELGFIGKPGKGDHWVFRHPDLREHTTVDARRPFLLPVYVRNAIRAIDSLPEPEE